MRSLLIFLLENLIKFKEFIREGKSDKLKLDEEQLSTLDKALKGDLESLKNIDRILKFNGPRIYAFITPDVKDCIKIGYTDLGVKARISQWQKKYTISDDDVLGSWSTEEMMDVDNDAENAIKVFFWDHAVHNKVAELGYEQLKDEKRFRQFITDKNRIETLHFSREFFNKYKDLSYQEREELSKDIIEDIINQMKAEIRANNISFKVYNYLSTDSNSGRTTIMREPMKYDPTPLLQEAIDAAHTAISEGKKNMLMAAVMRFGKTHASYQIVKLNNMKRVLVTSAKMDTRISWRNDVNHKDFIDDFVFVDFDGCKPLNCNITLKVGNRMETSYDLPIITDDGKDNINDAADGKTLIIFAGILDLTGSIKSIKYRHSKIFDKPFDMMIVDETHFASHAEQANKILKLRKTAEQSEEYDEDTKALIKNELKNAETLSREINNSIKYNVVLQVSGTPYYILASNEMIDDDAAIISTVSYNDMIEARDQWESDNPGVDPSESPYFGVPTLHKIGLNLTKECRKAINKSDKTGSMTELFKENNGKFVYHKALVELMKSVFGNDSSDVLGLLEKKEIDGKKICKHTLITVPLVIHAHLLKKLLTDEVLDTNKREVIVVVNNGLTGKADIIDQDDLNKKLRDLESKGKKSVIITLTRLLTGVSIPLLDSMLYMKNTANPQSYDQAIFRLCTRNVDDVSVEDNDGNVTLTKINRKRNVYLIDFNITNMLDMEVNTAAILAEAKAKAEGKHVTQDDIRKQMAENLRAIPLYSDSDTLGRITGMMKELSLLDMLKLYVKFNDNKSIGDVVDDTINAFTGLFKDRGFLQAIINSNIKRDDAKPGGKIRTGNDGEQDLDVDTDTKQTTQKDTPIGTGKNNTKDPNVEEAKQRFQRLVKNILYCNICLDTPYIDINKFINDIQADNELQSLASDFFNMKDLNEVFSNIPERYIFDINNLMIKSNFMMSNESKSDLDRTMTAVKRLGKIDKAEVMTPDNLVDKMVKKLKREDYKKAESILLVNSKCAEFLVGLVRNGMLTKEEAAKKCRIVPSGIMTRHLIEKVLKTMGLSNYIKSIILDINDNNDDGHIYDDFLGMEKEKIFKMNGGKKFDIILSNPPYDNKLHHRFLLKYLDIANVICSVQPADWLLSSSQNKQITTKIDEIGANIELINGNKYFDAGIANNLSIILINAESKNDILFNNIKYNVCSEIKPFSNDNFIVEFYDIIKDLLSDNLFSPKHLHNNAIWGGKYYIENEDKNSWCLKISQIRGNVNKKSDNLYSKDFYTIISNDNNFINKNVLGKWEDIKDIPNQKGSLDSYYYSFKTKNELINFYNYIRTDFVRACLIIGKYHNNQMRGCLKNIPWFDFSDEHFSKSPREIDDWLFGKYGISKEIRKHIEEILPDYYGIRK